MYTNLFLLFSTFWAVHHMIIDFMNSDSILHFLFWLVQRLLWRKIKKQKANNSRPDWLKNLCNFLTYYFRSMKFGIQKSNLELGAQTVLIHIRSERRRTWTMRLVLALTKNLWASNCSHPSIISGQSLIFFFFPIFLTWWPFIYYVSMFSGGF